MPAHRSSLSGSVTVVGAGYVGLANAVLLAANNNVRLLDIDKERIRSIAQRESPIHDQLLQTYLSNPSFTLHATTEPDEALTNTDWVIIAVPTNYDPATSRFDTTIVESVIKSAVHTVPKAVIVIKSTVPVGFTVRMMNAYPESIILFSPEFLREGQALEDSLRPSRIIVGGETSAATKFAELIQRSTEEHVAPIIITNPTEAEAIKLFSNTYLAMRIAFFNELDTYADLTHLDSAALIQGVSADPRIGNYYNNPSFGYGGYCLPKDTKQLLANYKGVPNDLISAIVASNETRFRYIADQILTKKPKVVGIYGLAMKHGSDNFRESAILRVIKLLQLANIDIILFEPLVKSSEFEGLRVDNDLASFTSKVDLIVTNRYAPELAHFGDKVFTRDIFTRD